MSDQCSLIEWSTDAARVSGERVDTVKVEIVLVSHPKVLEALVVFMPHNITGQVLCALVALLPGIVETDELKQELVNQIRTKLGPDAVPERMQFAPALPKTRSGKIRRRFLEEIAEIQTDPVP